MSTWDQTPQTVLEATGATVTTSHIAMAGEIIDVYTNRTEAASGAMLARDLEWLRKAVRFQAAFLSTKPAAWGIQQLQMLAADGVNQTFNQTGTGPLWSVILSPLAARSLKNLSWKAWRTLNPGRDSYLGLPDIIDFTNEQSDTQGTWTPL